MEKLAQRITNKLSIELNFDDDKRQIVAYGLLALIQIIISIALISFVSLIFGVIFEALIICFSVSILRKYSGGAHAGSIEICTIFSVFACVGFAIIIKYLLLTFVDTIIIIYLLLIVYAFSFVLLYLFAPVDSPNKPIKTEKKRVRMRKNSFLTLSIFFAISILFLFLGFKNKSFISLNLSLLLGILWQVFTLTTIGKHSLKKVDFIINKILSLKRR